MYRVTMLVRAEDAAAANAMAEGLSGPEAGRTFRTRVLDAAGAAWLAADVVAGEPLRLAMLQALAAFEAPIRWAIAVESTGLLLSDSEPGAEARAGLPWSWAATRALMGVREEGI